MWARGQCSMPSCWPLCPLQRTSPPCSVRGSFLPVSRHTLLYTPGHALRYGSLRPGTSSVFAACPENWVAFALSPPPSCAGEAPPASSPARLALSGGHWPGAPVWAPHDSWAPGASSPGPAAERPGAPSPSRRSWLPSGTVAQRPPRCGAPGSLPAAGRPLAPRTGPALPCRTPAGRGAAAVRRRGRSRWPGRCWCRRRAGGVWPAAGGRKGGKVAGCCPGVCKSWGRSGGPFGGDPLRFPPSP